MIHNDVIIAGFGGQGVLLSGKILAWAGMLEGLHVTWFPSYGAEMRGGTANCTVVMSDEEIGSPVVDRPGALIALNQASVDKFMPRVAKGGIVVVNSSLAREVKPSRGTRLFLVPANDIAKTLGDTRTLNIVMLGAYIGASGAVGLKSAVKALGQVIPERRRDILPLNIEALKRGFELVPQ